MPITIYPGSMKKRNANGSYSDLVPAIATDPEVLDDFAEEYSTSETYNIGDYCIHNSDLYKCNTNNTTGTWNSNAWERVSVADELADHKNTLNQLGTEVDTIENGLAIPQIGDTCFWSTTGLKKGQFIKLSGNSDQLNLPDGYYHVSQDIANTSAFTTSNLIRQYQGTSALNTIYNALPKVVTQNITFTTGTAENLSCSAYFGVSNAIVIKVQGTDAFWSSVFNSGRQTDTTKFDVNLPDAAQYSGTVACDIIYIPV